MTDPINPTPVQPPSASVSKRQRTAYQIDPQQEPEKYAQLRAELKAPYRGLRQFIYMGFGASGLIGAFIFLMQLLAGREVNAVLPNFALQVGVVALMVWLFRIEQRSADRAYQNARKTAPGKPVQPGKPDPDLGNR